MRAAGTEHLLHNQRFLLSLMSAFGRRPKLSCPVMRSNKARQTWFLGVVILAVLLIYIATDLDLHGDLSIYRGFFRNLIEYEALPLAGQNSNRCLDF